MDLNFLPTLPQSDIDHTVQVGRLLSWITICRLMDYKGDTKDLRSNSPCDAPRREEPPE
jgi:hypothetical protein